jgi:hypothetical protein
MQESFPPKSPTESSQPQIGQAAMQDSQLTQAYKAAGSNFYNIAVFSLINSVINLFQIRIYFPIGLGVTQIIDSIAFIVGRDAPEARIVFLIIGLVINLIIFGIVALFGLFIGKRTGWLIPLGGALYLLDGLLLLAFSDWIGAAFHGYFLYRIFAAWQAVRSVEKTNLPSAIGI